MPSFIVPKCGCAGGCAKCGTRPLFSPTERAGMAAAQVATMQDVCNYAEYRPELNRCSGQHEADKYPYLSGVCCGLDHATGGQRANTRARLVPGIGETTIDHTRALRLPAYFAAINPPERSEYTITHEKGQPSIFHKVYEQVGEIEIGPTGCVAKVREVRAE